jgi:hypothetical protein
MQPRTPAGEPVARVRNDDLTVAALDRDHSQQDGPARTGPAPDARADRPLDWTQRGRRLPGRLTGHKESSASPAPNLPAFAGELCAHAPAPPAGRETGAPAVAAFSAGATSGRMSIRQPVSLAASRAFWPSLPIASDNW